MSPEFSPGERPDVSLDPSLVPDATGMETDAIETAEAAQESAADTAMTASLGGAAVEGFAREGQPEPEKPSVPKPKRKPDGRKPKGSLEQPKAKGGRGHFKKHLKTQLTQSGKLNAKKPMTEEQKRLRRRKRK